MATRPKQSALPDIRVRPKDAQEARETIRRHNPALAMRLDVLFPVEACEHDWPKAQRGDPYGPINVPMQYICRGCGEEVNRIGGQGKWVSQAQYEEHQKRFREAIRRMQAKCKACGAETHTKSRVCGYCKALGRR